MIWGEGILIFLHRSSRAATFAVALAISSAEAAQNEAIQNSYPNPYRTIESPLKLPAGRTLGSMSAVGVDSKGNVWIAERCGDNTCEGKAVDPIMQFDANGKFIRAFGGGMMNWPHGMYIDREDNIWMTDARVTDGKGFQIFKFDQMGKVLMTLGRAGVTAPGAATYAFNEPSSVLVAPNGDIFVADGHTILHGSARVMKFDKTGRFVKQWGGHGAGEGRFEDPHCLAMDSEGRLFVGDRGNNRIQIFDQEGNFIAAWSQFGRPSGIVIDRNDILYVTDSESRNTQGYGHNPGWKRGIRIGNAKDGKVIGYIPDAESDPEPKLSSGAEGIAVARDGTIFGAEVGGRTVKKYVKK